MKTTCMTQLEEYHTFFASPFFDKEKSEGYECATCHKRFNRPSALKTHIFTHSGEKPYACDVLGCGRRFSVISNLRRHSKVHNRPQTLHRTRLSSNERNKFVQRLIDKRNQSSQPASQESRPVSMLSVRWLINQDDSQNMAHQ